MEKGSIFKLLHLIFIILTIVIGVTTIIAAFSSHVHPIDSAWIPFLGLILPGLLFLNAIIAIYWIIRFRFWLWIPIIAIAINYDYISCMYQNPFKTQKLATKETTLKVATFNVGRFGRDDNGFNQRSIAFFMYEQNVDVICMQEYKERGHVKADSLKSVFNAWPYMAIPKTEDEKNLLQLAVYSRYPIVDSQLITFDGSPNCSMWCDITYEGKTIRIFNNHLQTTNINQTRNTYTKYYKEANSLDVDIDFATSAGNLYHQNEIMRANQADIVSKYINESPHPVIVCGDFNALPSSYVYRTMKGDLTDGFRIAGKGFGGTFRYYKGIPRIDYIFHSPSLKTIDYYSPKEDFGSDHNPVIIEIE